MVKSARGKEVNIDALRIANQYSVAAGNANVNARGDLLGKNGKVVKTREELAQEYNTKNTNAVKNVAISKDVPAVMKAEEEKTAQANADLAKKSKKANTEESPKE